jgi:hypothetical protein
MPARKSPHGKGSERPRRTPRAAAQGRNDKVRTNRRREGCDQFQQMNGAESTYFKKA